MTVLTSKPAVNIRSELADLKKPAGLAGAEMLSATTIVEQAALLGIAPKNIIKNGAIAIDQRGAFAGVSVSGTSGSDRITGFGPDRFKLYMSETFTTLDATIRQTADGPSGFSTCLEIETITVETAAANGDLYAVQHLMEGFDVQGLGWGTSEAKPVTLQFWVKSNTPGTYPISMYMAEGGGDQVNFTYTIEQSEVWQQIVWVIPGNFAAAPANDNTVGLTINMAFAAGATYKGGGSQPNWGAYANNKWADGIEVDLGAIDGNYFRMTGVQLTKGSFPEGVPFEHKSFSDDLRDCQRYFYRPTTAGDLTGNTFAQAFNSSGVIGSFVYKETMRATPAIVSFSIGNGTAGQIRKTSDGAATSSAGAANIGLNSFGFVTGMSGLTTGDAYDLTFTADAEL